MRSQMTHYDFNQTHVLEGAVPSSAFKKCIFTHVPFQDSKGVVLVRKEA